MSDAKPRVYLRKHQLRTRYGWESERSVDRAVKAGRLPRPATYIGQYPLWDAAELDEHDRKITVASVNRGFWPRVGDTPA
jgi:hypothetical protein